MRIRGDFESTFYWKQKISFRTGYFFFSWLNKSNLIVCIKRIIWYSEYAIYTFSDVMWELVLLWCILVYLMNRWKRITGHTKIFHITGLTKIAQTSWSGGLFLFTCCNVFSLFFKNEYPSRIFKLSKELGYCSLIDNKR